MAEHCPIKVIEHSEVSPPPGSVPTTSLPLTFFDTFWVSCYRTQRLFFYEFPSSTSHFMQNSLPNLKTSLSLTLKTFFLFAGNLRLPPLPQQPHIYYTGGDSIPFIVAESTADKFKRLTERNDQILRRGHELEDLVPKLTLPTMYSDGDNFFKQQPLMAIQITIFPSAGISIGLTFCHVAADGRAFSHFTKSWASICKTKGDSTFVNISPPDYSRNLIQDPQGISSIFLNETLDVKAMSRLTRPVENVRITYVINRTEVEMLKKWIATKSGNLQESPRLSSFVVTTAFMWVNLLKLHQTKKISDELARNDDGVCLFAFQADCRDRLRLPTNYFGNCLRPCYITARTSELIGENGAFVAAKAIEREIQEFEKEPLKGAENWIRRGNRLFNECEHFITLAGSPKLKVYDTDFGFERPIKSEVVHISSQGSVSMAESRDKEGGVEFGLVVALDELDKFNVIFRQSTFNM